MAASNYPEPCPDKATEGAAAKDVGLETNRPGERLGAGCVAIPFALLAFWMWWIIHKYPLNGDGWWDFIVGNLVEKLVLATGLLAVTFVIWALFAPRRIGHLLNVALNKTFTAIGVFFLVLFFGSWVMESYGPWDFSGIDGNKSDPPLSNECRL